MSLWADFQTNPGRLIVKWKHYFPVYERYLHRYVNRPVILVEIGVGAGGSLAMWKRYLGPHAVIVGLDINPGCRAFEEDQVHVRTGDQSDAAFLDRVVAEFGRPDVVIDDGSHVMAHVNASFDHLYPKLARDGVYIVEDLHTAYAPEYGGGLRRPGTFIERCKGFLDQLNGEYTPGKSEKTFLTSHTLGLHVHDSIIVLERGNLTAPRAVQSAGGKVS